MDGRSCCLRYLLSWFLAFLVRGCQPLVMKSEKRIRQSDVSKHNLRTDKKKLFNLAILGFANFQEKVCTEKFIY